MFCSNSVGMHLLRGVAAVALIVAAFFFSRYGWLWSVFAAVGAIFLLRGCPMCWLMGLFEVMSRQKSRSNT